MGDDDDNFMPGDMKRLSTYKYKYSPQRNSSHLITHPESGNLPVRCVFLCLFYYMYIVDVARGLKLSQREVSK